VIHVGSWLWVGRRHAHAVVFGSLCIDLLVLLYLVTISGGIRSPLMPAQLVFTMIFALLFPSPLAIVPPLLMLPAVARIDQLVGMQSLPHDLLFVLWYSALNVIVVYIVVYLEGREKTALQEVVRLQRDRRVQALAQQRVSIAREIHDGVGAALSGIVLQAEFLAGSVRGGPLEKEVRELRDAATEGMDELRRAVSLLHREFRLTSAVPDYANGFAERHQIGLTSEVRGAEPAISPERALALFRVMQEALSNVAHHASARHVYVTLDFESPDITLGVRDDGRGFQPAGAIPGHYGLRNMAERAARVGGELDVESAPGKGTSVKIRIPRADRLAPRQ
jgi:two-component system sensor histidine kinase DegS